MFNKIPLIVKKQSIGSEDGIHIKNFEPGDEPQLVEEKLAQVFVSCGVAEYPVAKKDDKKKDDGHVMPAETKPMNKKIETK